MANPEKQFESRVRKYLSEIGAYVVKYWGGTFTRSGVPDLLICFKGHFIAIELKSEKGIPSKLQLYNKKQIENAGGVCFILYPHEFNDFKEYMERL